MTKDDTRDLDIISPVSAGEMLSDEELDHLCDIVMSQISQDEGTLNGGSEGFAADSQHPRLARLARDGQHEGRGLSILLMSPN